MDDYEDYLAAVLEYDRDAFSASVSGVDSGGRNHRVSASGQTQRRGGAPGRGMTFVTTRQQTRARANRGDRPYGELSRDEYWIQNHPVLRKFDWGHTTIQLPVIAPHSESKQVKKQIHTTTVTKIRNSRANWGDKCDMLLSNFSKVAPMASTEANTAISDFMSFASDCYTFEDPELADRNATAIDAPGHANAFEDNTREQARYVKFTLAINPRNIETNSQRVDSDRLQRTAYSTVYLRAILTGQRLHHELNRVACLQRPKDLIAIYDNRGQPFDLLVKTRGDPAANNFRAWLDEVRNETRFEALVQITEMEYVGKMEGLETITQRLQQIKQVIWDPKNTRNKIYTVQELHEQYQSILAEYSGNNPDDGADLPTLAHTLHNALANKLKDRVTGFLPNNTPQNFRENLNAYNEFKEHVSKAEQEIKNIISIVRPIVGPTTRNRASYPTGQRAFVAMHEEHDAADDEEYTTTGYKAYPPEPIDPQEQHEVDEEASKPAGITLPPLTMFAAKEKKLVTNLVTCLSVAETALREASGTRAPLKCWGCQDVSDYKHDCYHRWEDCPRKGDPRTIKAFQINLEKFREQRRQSNGTRYWKNSGYPSHQTASQIAAIARGDTTPAVRKVLLTSLRDQLNNDLGGRHSSDDDPPPYSTGYDEPTSQGESPPQQPTHANKKVKFQTTMTIPDPRESKSKRKKPKIKGRAFLQYFKGITAPETHPRASNTGRAMVFFNESRKRYNFDISDKLPFLEMPIGTGHEDEAEKLHTLAGLLDSGGCCNMGWLAYHKKIVERYPYLVHSMVKLSEEQYEDINIGGIKDGVWITHIVEYWIPFQSNEGQSTLKIGLTEDLPIATLFGLPFQINASIKPDWNTQRATSTVFNTTFRLRMNRPERPPLSSLDYDDGKSRTLLSTQPNSNDTDTSSSSEDSDSQGDMSTDE